MKRTRIIALSLLVLALAVLAGPPRAARADTLSVSADVPIVYRLNDAAFEDTKPNNGLVLGVSLPLLLGLGYENYLVSGKLNAQDFEYRVQMVDVYFDLPFPAANLRLGGGAGTGTLTVDATPGAYDPALLSQFFLNVGVPFAGVFDVHVGYHVIQGKADVVGTGTTLPLSSTMATVGLKMGF